MARQFSRQEKIEILVKELKSEIKYIKKSALEGRSVSEVRRKLGNPDPTYFGEAFKQVFGMNYRQFGIYLRALRDSYEADSNGLILKLRKEKDEKLARKNKGAVSPKLDYLKTPGYNHNRGKRVRE